MVGRSPRLRRIYALESEAGKIKLFDKYIDNTNRIILGHMVVQVLRKQRALPAIFASIKRFMWHP